MLVYYLAPMQNDVIVTSPHMQFTFGDKREVYQLDENALPVTEKESVREGKRSISPWMKCGHANLSLNCMHRDVKIASFCRGAK